MTTALPSTERRRIRVQGVVQGVGFRPFVYGQALRCGLGGFVRNDSAGVTIEIEGAPADLEAFERALREQPPPLARIDRVAAEPLSPLGEHSFAIAHSQAGAERRTLIAPDSATCDDCLREMLDPADRRADYAFTNCTNCGPRFTIVQDVPYDRAQTTMRVFRMCPACAAEYANPLNRRFHAQPNACPVCGPALDFHLNDAHLHLLSTSPLDAAAHALAAGAILSVKGLGGYHLACDALNAAAVARLRQRKHREAKPFAIMLPDLATARLLCHVGPAEAALLESRRRPIVLLRRRANCTVPLAPDLAPVYATLGVMLPYTPLHHLLLRDFAAAAPGRPAVLVMTSGNLSDEPIAYRDDDARARLATIADGALTHNRAIHMRCDDSVMHVVGGSAQLLRRARGYAPEPIALASASPAQVLAVGGHLKNTFCLLKGRQAFVSHHIGDLENLETLASFREGIAHYQRLFDIMPTVIAHDLHPEYVSTRYAQEIGDRRWGMGDSDGTALDIAPHLPAPNSQLLIPVQHHHAHIASVLAEHGLDGPVIGVAADGTGYGTDGAIWGCEIMRADLRGFERLAHLAYVPLPGGEQAVRQPWRVAAAYLHAAFGDDWLDLDIPFVRDARLHGPPLRARWRPLAQMIARGINSPPTSSLGRLFDAVAALLGLCDEVVYEGQAAIELEMLAAPDPRPYPFTIVEGMPAQLDVAPAIRAIVGEIERAVPLPQIAGRFHCTVAALLAEACERARAATGLREVALSGGVFQNRMLLENLLTLLEQRDFTVYLNRQVPPNDGGLSLGQAAVAAALVERDGVTR